MPNSGPDDNPNLVHITDAWLVAGQSLVVRRLDRLKSVKEATRRTSSGRDIGPVVRVSDRDHHLYRGIIVSRRRAPLATALVQELRRRITLPDETGPAITSR
jgi:hypothetical protein